MKIWLPYTGNLESAGVLFALLPGLLAYVIFRLLTARERRFESVEAVLYGLAFTLLANALWAVLTLRSWLPTPDIVGLSLCSIALGTVFAAITNSGRVYDALRRCGITNEASWQSAWESSFRYAKRNQQFYAVLHLKDGRRLMGWVLGFSDAQSGGHVSLVFCRWLNQDDSVIFDDGIYVVPGEEIRYVQFLPPVAPDESKVKSTPIEEEVRNEQSTD